MSVFTTDDIDELRMSLAEIKADDAGALGAAIGLLNKMLVLHKAGGPANDSASAAAVDFIYDLNKVITTLPSPAERMYDLAVTAYHIASGRLMRSARTVVVERTRKAFPTAATLHLTCACNEDGLVRAEITGLTDAEGKAVGAHFQDALTWDRWTDELNDPLMWLTELNGDEYHDDVDIDLIGTS